MIYQPKLFYDVTMPQDAAVVNEVVAAQQERTPIFQELPPSLGEIRKTLGLSEKFDLEAYASEVRAKKEEALVRFKEKYKRESHDSRKAFIPEDAEKVWAKNLETAGKHDRYFHEEKDRLIQYFQSQGVNTDFSFHLLELVNGGKTEIYIPPNEYYGYGRRHPTNYFKEFYRDLSKNRAAVVSLCKSMDAFPKGTERLITLCQWQTDEFSYKELESFLPRLETIPEETFKSVLEGMQEYKLLLPSRITYEKNTRQIQFVLGMMERGGIGKQEKQFLNNVSSLSKLLKYNDADFYLNPKLSISELLQESEDELELIKTIILAMEEHYFFYKDYERYEEGRNPLHYKIPADTIITELKQKKLLHPLAEVLRKGFRISDANYFEKGAERWAKDAKRYLEQNNASMIADFESMLEDDPKYFELKISSRSNNWLEPEYQTMFLRVADSIINAYESGDKLKILREYWRHGYSQPGEYATNGIIRGARTESEKVFWEFIGNQWGTYSELIKCKTWFEVLLYEAKADHLNEIENWREEDLLKVLSPFEKAFWEVLKNLPKEEIAKLSPGDFNEKTMKKYRILSTLLTKLDQTNSKELRKFKGEITTLLTTSDNPEQAMEQIISVFERNNLPEVGKIYRVFEMLHPPGKLKEAFRKNVNLSPVLHDATDRRRYDIIYRDLLKVHIESVNPSLYKYLQVLKSGQELVDKVDAQGVDSLSKDVELPQLLRFLNRMDTLLENSLYGRRAQYSSQRPEDLLVRIQELKKSYGVKEGESLTERVARMFAVPLGYKSLNQVLERMNAVKREAGQRNISLAANIMNIKLVDKEDLLKGFDDNYIDLILQNGVVAKEYLGADAGSDATPFDTDASRVLEEDAIGNLSQIVKLSLATGYGKILFVFKNRGQFQETEQGKENKFDQEKYELFPSVRRGDRHYGIRTGIPSTQIDAMINNGLNKEELERVYFLIAQNGFYIPVVDQEGKLLFTPEMYEGYRITRDSIKTYLEGEDKSAVALLNVLKKSPYIKSLFNSGVGVWEGYTLEQHTKMVMGQYEKYFTGKWKSPLLSEDDFRILLGLHDLGKPLAVKMTGDTHNQHEYTMRYLPIILDGLGIDVKQADLITALVSGDYLGQYIQGNAGLEETGRMINMKAKEAGVPVDQFLELLKMYYACDASAYTSDAGGQPSLDRLFIFNHENGSITFSQEIQEKLNALSPYIFLE